MARIKPIYSSDAITTRFEGDKKNPEPPTGVILFPGGRVEVSRCSDESYWAHISVDDSASIRSGRIDRRNRVDAVGDFPDADDINHIAINI